MLRRAWAIVILGACSLYGSNPDAPVCNGVGGGTIAIPQGIDPQTGECEQSGPTPSWPCDPACGPCAEQGYSPGSDTPPTTTQDWAPCSGACEQLDEAQCLASTACHTAYLTNAFWHCFDMPPSGAIEGGTCVGLDPQTCSEHDDCVSNYGEPGPSAGSSVTEFSSCAAKASPPPPPPACSTLTTAAACTARTDCEPIYVGTQCTCTPTTCTCQVETFEYCQPN